MNTHALFGIPIDNVHLSQAIEQIMSMIEQYPQDGKPKYVATVNLDFLANIHGWGFRDVRHPELLNIIRKANLRTADGMPLVWLSRILGSPLKERVAGADLLPYLAEALSRKRKSMFLLGGTKKVTKEAAEHLRHHFPGIRVIGVACPFI